MGFFDFGTGAGTAKSALNRANANQDAAVTRQNSLLDLIRNGVSGYLSGDIGYDPRQLSLMRSQALNQLTKSYSGAKSNLMSVLRARGAAGGDMPMGGDAIRGLSGLEGSYASDRSSTLANIDLSNLQQMLSNKWNAISALSGNANTVGNDIGVFGSMANNALNTYADSIGKGFGGQFTQTLGQGLGKMTTGGIASMLKKAGVV